MLFHSLSCERTEGTKKAALRGTTQARSQSLFGFQPSTIEQDDEAVLAGSTAASSGSLERDFVNQGEDLDCQAPAEDAGTGDSRSRKIAAIVKMLSSAAEEFEAGSKGAQGRLQQASCGPFTPKARTLERASLDRPAAESPASPSVDNRGVMESLSVQTLKTSHLANRIADPQSVDNGVAGDASKLSVPQSPNEKAQSNLLHHDVAYGVGPYGTPTIPFYSVVLREASEPVVQAPFAGSMLANLQLESTEDNFSRTNGVSKKSGCNGTQGNSNFGYVPSYMLQPVTSCQATTIKAGPSSVSVSVSKAPGNGAGTDIPTPTLAHPYVRLPFVPREAITRTFDFKCALSCGLHDRFVLTHLETMRTLFAKESLDWISVNKLLSTSQRLVNHAFFLLRLPQVPDIPSRVNRKLGLLFLTFDAVVCTIELLGESMLTGAWWRKFTGAFNTDYYLKATGTIVPAETGRAGFGNRLLSALRIYKTGRRPHAEEIISLKRLLFCSNVSPDIFQRRQWDQWRLDDKEWCGAKWTGV
ncbi:hypothetical protein, conserved [Eimeria maxima]|uniref:Uncharacterized protein n=1 Tax=Eimeria maxima TaxID=5804 RepID=U6M7N0_EIMMA|nr:hypothetical protein, conserved [Eimeria maxima]CDJ60227.1 hypothetical protein, conserved [Eimeria maxima]